MTTAMTVESATPPDFLQPSYQLPDNLQQPCDLDAERMMLGVVLIENNTWYQIPTDWDVRNFYWPSHRKIYAGMIRCFRNHGGVDPLILQNALRDSGDLDSVGGPVYIASLFDGVPRFSNIEAYINIVHHKYLQRQLIVEGNILQQRGYDGEADIDETVRSVEERLFHLKTGSGGRMQSEWFESVLNRAWDMERRPAATATGLTQLDSLMLGGGISPGDLVIVGARTSRGKSTIAKQIAGNICDRYDLSDMDTRPVGAFFALEESVEALARRIIGERAELSWQSMQRWQFTEEEYARLMAQMRRARHWRLACYDIRRTTISDIAKECRRIRRETGQLDFVVVDHLSLVKLEKGVRYEKEYQEIGYLTSEMKTLAGERGIMAPFIVPTQIKREALNKKRFDVDDLRGSGAIEQDADKVIILQMPEAEEETGYDLEITLAKQREGQVGSVMGRFSRAYGGFREIPGTRNSGLTSERRRVRAPEPTDDEDNDASERPRGGRSRRRRVDDHFMEP